MKQLTGVDQTLAAATQAQQIPGVVAMVTTDKETIYQGVFGKRALDAPAAMTLDSVFWLASMTKAITSVAAMQLVEQGKLALDEPVGNVLPDLASPQVLDGFDAGGKPMLRAARRPITLRHLMTHTAGFGYGTWNAALGQYMTQASVPATRSCLNRSLLMPLSFDPGDRWEYGINTDWLGKVIEAASGTRLDVYLRDLILAPLGMPDTAFKIGASQRQRLVGMHQRAADGALSPTPFELEQEPEFHMGGGGLYSTAPDYIRFVRMLLNGGALDGIRVLKPETVALMGENHIGDLVMSRLPTFMPAVSNDFDPWPEQDKKWGLGFMMNTRRTAEGRSPGSLAWAGLANTYFWVDPARKVGGVILMQLLPFADGKALELFAALERGVYQAMDGAKAAA
jgi:CubicO group peptidase (beta-lactamase class C family)